MKHTIETRNQFIQLRAAGESFGTISEKLAVAKSTLHQWQDDHADDIARLRRIRWEEWETEACVRIESRLEDLVCRIADYELRLSDFKLGQLSLRDTVMLLRESRREYFRLRALLMGTPARRNKSQPNKTERSSQTAQTNPRNTNDLQRSPAQSFGPTEATDPNESVVINSCDSAQDILQKCLNANRLQAQRQADP